METIDKIFRGNGFVLNNTQLDQFNKYLLYLKEENIKYNLTSITDDCEIVTKHFLDSILPLKYVKGKVLDIGSGAGFPGIPLKIMDNTLELTLVDSVYKKVNFMQNLCVRLGFDNVNCMHVRAEDIGDKYKNTYDVVVSRAVARLNTLIEYCLPYVKVGGYMIAYKSKSCDEEIKECDNGLNILGGKIEKILEYNIDGNERKLVLIKKIKSTDVKYPRKQNKPRTNPL